VAYFREGVMEYIRAHLLDLRNLADARDAHMLVYLIDMAIAETADILNGKPTLLGKEDPEKCNACARLARRQRH
jgi:hypothetical protein